MTFPDVAKLTMIPGQGAPAQTLVLLQQNGQDVGYVRLGEGDYVTVGDEPTLAGLEAL